MKKIRRFMVVKIIVAMLLTTTILVGCAQKPSEDDVKGAIKLKLQKDIPMMWIRGGHDFTLTSLEIIEWGKSRKEYGRDVWPVKCRVIATFKWTEFKLPKNKETIQHFDKTTDFTAYKNDYEVWEVSFADIKDNI